MKPIDDTLFDRDMEIFELIEKGVPVSEVSEKFNLTRVRIRNIYQEVFSFLYEAGNIEVEQHNKFKEWRDYKTNPRYKEIAEDCYNLKQKRWSDKRIARKLKTKPATVRKAIEYYKMFKFKLKH